MKNEIPDTSPNKLEITSSEVVLLNAEHFASVAKPKRPFKIVLIAIFLLIISGWLSYYAVNGLSEAWSTKNWPTTRGEVLTSEMMTRLSEGSEIYSINIDYKYTVANETYHGYEVQYGSRGVFDSNKQSKMSTISLYPSGKTVTVFYNPKSPSHSVLETGVHFNNIILSVIGLVFLLVSLVLMKNNVPLIFRKN